MDNEELEKDLHIGTWLSVVIMVALFGLLITSVVRLEQTYQAIKECSELEDVTGSDVDAN